VLVILRNEMTKNLFLIQVSNQILHPHYTRIQDDRLDQLRQR